MCRVGTEQVSWSLEAKYTIGWSWWVMYGRDSNIYSGDDEYIA